MSAPAGPLLAVCNLCGGAGASTIAYLVARMAAQSTGDQVLVCDSGGPTGGLAAYAGAESPRSLPGLANAVAAHEPLAEALFADAGPRLRVLGGPPRLHGEVDPNGLAWLLRDARATHALTVVDCGTPHTGVDLLVIEAATHVAWVLPATASAVRRGSPVLELFACDAPRREIVVARRDSVGRQAPMSELTELASARDAPLVLVPHVPDLWDRSPDEALEAAQLSLEAIVMAVRR